MKRIEIAMNHLIGSVGEISFVSADEIDPAFHTLLQRRKRQQRGRVFVRSFCVGKVDLRGAAVASLFFCGVCDELLSVDRDERRSFVCVTLCVCPYKYV